MAGPAANAFLNEYKIDFTLTSPFKGQTTKSAF